MRTIYILFLSLILASCGASVGIDYDKETDFSQYTTYNFYPSIASGLSELDDKRIMQFTDSILQQRGFTKTENPQLFINFFARETLANSRNTIGIGIGSGGGNVGVGVSGGIPIGGHVIEQQLTFDMIDVSRDDLVWQAVAEGEIKERATPEQKEAYYLSLIETILKKFPPKQ